MVASATMFAYTAIMGIYDRDYFQQPPARSSIGKMQMWSVTTWLIVINVAVFVLDPILARSGIIYEERITPQIVMRDMPLKGLGQFVPFLAVWRLEVWRFLTFQFLHAGLAHLLFNMLSLYFFGPLIEAYLGSRRYLAFYLLCGIGGPIAFILLWATGFLGAHPLAEMVGASAGIFGVLLAAARIAPRATVLLYGMFPMQLKTLAWALLALAVYTVLAYGGSGERNAGGEAAHLGGAAVGMLLIRNPQWLNVFQFGFSRRRRPPF